MGVSITLPKMFCWYLARMRTFTQLSDGDLVSFCVTNTLLLLVVGALQHYFCLPRSLTQRTPFWPRPASNSSPLRPLSQVDSSGEDAPSSRNVRPSTRSRRGRQGSGQSPCFASPARTWRADAEKESSESGSPEGEALDGGSHHSLSLIHI